MTVTLTAITCGHLTLPTGFLLAGRKGTTKVPITSYLIDHPKGRVIFDTGLHLDTQNCDPTAHIGEFLAKYHRFDYGAGEDIASRLMSIDVDPASITHVVNSHLHFDHCGGNALLPNATILVQRHEVEAAHEGGLKRGYVASDFETGQPKRTINGDLDLFGDSTVVLFPTFGHTAGHQSLEVRVSSGGRYVLCGDACYCKEALDTMTLPGVLADPDAATRSFQMFLDLQQQGATLMYGHDLDFWATVPQAPTSLP